MRKCIRFIKAGHVVELNDVAPTETLLDYLRLRARETGTKEGCSEGDCGACTVALGRFKDGQLIYEPVNSCILLLAQIDGCELVTIEDLSRDGGLHPVQKAFVDHHASQCGFCTPGFIMSLFTLYHRDTPGLTSDDVTTWLAGNLCRCTGYRPIVDAALETCRSAANDAFRARAEKTEALLRDLADPDDILMETDGDRFIALPSTLDSLCALSATHTDATLVSGATDVGLWITKQLRDLPKIIALNRVQELRDLQVTSAGFDVGAGVSFQKLHEVLGKHEPDIAEVLRRLGSIQVRTSGTMGGNIANGSPIGDSPPLLIALGAQISLRLGNDTRRMPLEAFFLDYGKQDRRPGEVITQIHIPRLDASHAFRAFKLSKRFDQDISTVLAAFRFTLVQDRIVEARLAYGGMAGVPRRAAHAETALMGCVLSSPDSWNAAVDALDNDFTPLSDMRGSAEYRREAAKGLLFKALLEVSGRSSQETRICGHRYQEAGHAA